MPRSRSVAYLPGLDGLRALAVIAVVLYHSGQTWLPGGFLGVEVFFVISGYIITSGLLAEWRETGQVSVVGFWGRRALRLLPALFALLATLLIGALVFSPGELDQLRGDTLAAVAYVTNWNLILGHQDYFESFGRPALLQHLWSLAVEEQFYIVWPLVFAVLIRVMRPRFAGLLLVGGAAASAGLMALSYRDVYDASRIYYGTDTRASGLLLGAALAFVLAPASRPSWLGRAGLTLLGLGGLAGLTAIAWLMGQYDPALYQGGFLLTGLASVAVIAAVSRPDCLLGRAVGVMPLRWLGLRSYGIYLWHWPLLLLTEPAFGHGPGSLGLRLALVLAIAEVSYRLVETPARRGALGKLWASLTVGPTHAWSYKMTFGLLASVVGSVAFTVSMTAVRAPAARASHSNAVDAQFIYEVIPDGAGLLVEEWSPVTPANPLPPEPQPSAAEVAAAPAPPPPLPPPPLPVVGVVPMPAGITVTAVGDSVMLGASRQMAYLMGSIEVDADVGRQVWSAVAVLRERAAAGRLGDVVVIGFGSNGSFTAREFDQMMEILADTRLVVFVNVRVPRPWEDANNRVIARGVAAHPNAVMVDWYGSTDGHPELFGNDGVHLTGPGVRLYSGLIADAIVANWK